MNNPPVGTASTLDELLSRLPSDPNLRGDAFEKVVKWFLQTDPAYTSELSEVWLWDEWPDRFGGDMADAFSIIGSLFKELLRYIWESLSAASATSATSATSAARAAPRRGPHRGVLGRQFGRGHEHVALRLWQRLGAPRAREIHEIPLFHSRLHMHKALVVEPDLDLSEFDLVTFGDVDKRP